MHPKRTLSQGLGLHERVIPALVIKENKGLVCSHLKAISSLEEGFKKIFWAVYPQLKTDASAILEQLKLVAEVLHRIDELPGGAIRNKQSYSHELQGLVNDLYALEPKLQHSLEQAQAKAKAKGISFDAKLASFIGELKASLPKIEKLTADGYWLD